MVRLANRHVYPLSLLATPTEGLLSNVVDISTLPPQKAFFASSSYANSPNYGTVERLIFFSFCVCVCKPELSKARRGRRLLEPELQVVVRRPMCLLAPELIQVVFKSNFS